jgi:hypothetical protein
MISFDDKSKTIAIAGPFDPQRLACKIRCRGGKTVKDVQIVDVPGGNGKPPPLKIVDAPPAQSPVNKNGRKKQPPPPSPQPSSPPPEPAQAPPPEMPHSPPPQPATPDRGMATTMPPFHEEEKPVPRPAELEPPPQKANPPPMECYMPPPPVMNPRPPPPPCPKAPEPFPAEYVIPPARSCGCPCCAPCYQGYREACSCGCGGARMYGCSAAGPPYGYRGCRIIIEEDPNAACSVM